MKKIHFTKKTLIILILLASIIVLTAIIVPCVLCIGKNPPPATEQANQTI